MKQSNFILTDIMKTGNHLSLEGFVKFTTLQDQTFDLTGEYYTIQCAIAHAQMILTWLRRPAAHTPADAHPRASAGKCRLTTAVHHTNQLCISTREL